MINEFIPISALQHILFCERQWALIHLERVWVENRLTAEGRLMHKNVHKDNTEMRNGKLRICGLRISSSQFKIQGQMDVMEAVKAKPEENGIVLPNREGYWIPVPVEYKRGKPKQNACDEVQVCAQALCIEEMMNTRIKTGMIYYGMPRRRIIIKINDQLRELTVQLINRITYLSNNFITPPAKLTKACRSCSLKNHCLPKIASKSALTYNDKLLNEVMKDEHK